MQDYRGDGSPRETPGLAWGPRGHCLVKASGSSTGLGYEEAKLISWEVECQAEGLGGRLLGAGD